MVHTEVRQYLAEKNGLDYLLSGWNLADLVTLPITTFLTINSLLQWVIERPWMSTEFMQALRILAAFDSLFLVLKIYDWMRLFDSTAFYVQLLLSTLKKIGPFLLLFIVALLLFGLPISMLNQNRFRYSEEEQMIQE